MAAITRREDTSTLFMAALPTPAAPRLVVYPKFRRDRPDNENSNYAVLRVGAMKFDQSRSVNTRLM